MCARARGFPVGKGSTQHTVAALPMHAQFYGYHCAPHCPQNFSVFGLDKQKSVAIIFMFRGCSSSGRAPPCQGGGSEFEPRHPLHIFGIAPTLVGAILFLYCQPFGQLGQPGIPRRDQQVISNVGRRVCHRNALPAGLFRPALCQVGDKAGQRR